jgi:hypothetical protein
VIVEQVQVLTQPAVVQEHVTSGEEQLMFCNHHLTETLAVSMLAVALMVVAQVEVVLGAQDVLPIQTQMFLQTVFTTEYNTMLTTMH